jgi:ubiquinone/menaquinone biosynthesis C-methylase UbiE
MTTSKQFYTKLTPEGLAERKKAIYTKKELKYIKKLLNKKQKILDIGCGYGRFTIPLAKQRYNIQGIDITPSLIKKAKKLANKEKVNIIFKIGDMRKLPYKDNNFDAIICMWSVFIELTNKSDQLKAIKEMKRVLFDNGFALIEMPLPYNPSIKTKDDLRLKKGNIITGKISGIEAMPTYFHNKETLVNLMKESKTKKYKIFIDKFGGRNRLFLQFWKN